MIIIQEIKNVVSDPFEIIQMADKAEKFLRSHQWCTAIKTGFLDRALAGVLAVFLFDITPSSLDVDSKIWVIVGDVSPAYIEFVSCPTGIDALESYCYCLEGWVDNILAGKPIDDVMPVYYSDGSRILEPTLANATLLQSKIETLRNQIVPWLKDWTPEDK